MPNIAIPITGLLEISGRDHGLKSSTRDSFS